MLIRIYECSYRLHLCHAQISHKKINQLLIYYHMLVEQFRITDLYHPLTMPSFLMLVHSPCMSLRTSPTQSEPSTRQALILLPIYTQRTNHKLDARECEFGAQHAEGHGSAQILSVAWTYLVLGVLAGSIRSTFALGNAADAGGAEAGMELIAPREGDVVQPGVSFGPRSCLIQGIQSCTGLGIGS